MDRRERNEDVMGAAEALLFIYGEPMEKKRIAKVLGVQEEILETSLEKLKERYAQEGSGIFLVAQGDKVQLATKPEFAGELEEFMKADFQEQLTPAALETLTLIAYLAPISRAQLDYYRGVNSRFMVRSLMMRGLIERIPDPQRAGNYLYSPTTDLLRHLGVSRPEELPEFASYREKFIPKEGVSSGEGSQKE